MTILELFDEAADMLLRAAPLSLAMSVLVFVHGDLGKPDRRMQIRLVPDENSAISRMDVACCLADLRQKLAVCRDSERVTLAASSGLLTATARVRPLELPAETT